MEQTTTGFYDRRFVVLIVIIVMILIVKVYLGRTSNGGMNPAEPAAPSHQLPSSSQDSVTLK